MKRFILISLLILIPLNAFGWEFFMEKCIQSWVGYSLDSLISKWGYPDNERSIAGRKLYEWITYDNNVEYVGGLTITSTDKKGNETSISAGGVPKVEYCRKTIEVNEDNIIQGGQYDGTFCPKFYFAGKKLVNPQNNPWVK